VDSKPSIFGSKAQFNFGSSTQAESQAKTSISIPKDIGNQNSVPSTDSKPTEPEKSQFLFSSPKNTEDSKPFLFGQSTEKPVTETEAKTSIFGSTTTPKPSAFSFSVTPTSYEQKPVPFNFSQTSSTQAPSTFTFGNSESTSSKPSFGEPTKGFTFGSTSTASAQPASASPFIFGQQKESTAPDKKVTSPFTFGLSPSSTTAPTFTQPNTEAKPATSHSFGSSGFQFGSHNSSQQQAPFSFGAKSASLNEAGNKPTEDVFKPFSFSAPPAQPTFTFGAPFSASQDQQQSIANPIPMSFGGSNSQPTMPTFSFGSNPASQTSSSQPPFTFGQSDPALTFNMGSSSPAISGRPKTTPVSRRRPNR
jgi:hypothetical protein